ncbi:uncharacterized protein [Amphiura filiformis]|uniref:uncharacterized protein n=1 Tax=Amphiura filiformis TaxID=82378 RepID=UPI003B22752D
MGVIIGSMATSVSMLAMGLVVSGCNIGAEAVGFAILPEYFDKYYDVSNGIAHAGLAVGVMVMPLITQFLLEVYGWRGTMLIIGGLNAHITVCGALLKPLERRQLSDDNQNHEDTRKHCSDNNVKVTQKDNLVIDDYESDKQPLVRLQWSDNNQKDTDNLEPIDDHKEHNVQQTSVMANFISAFDLHLFVNIEFVSLMCLSTACGYYYTGWLIYLVPHAEHLGFSPYASSALATSGGIGWLYDQYGNFTASFLFLSIIPLLALTPMLLNMLKGVICNQCHDIRWATRCTTSCPPVAATSSGQLDAATPGGHEDVVTSGGLPDVDNSLGVALSEVVEKHRLVWLNRPMADFIADLTYEDWFIWRFQECGVDISSEILAASVLLGRP